MTSYFDVDTKSPLYFCLQLGIALTKTKWRGKGGTRHFDAYNVVCVCNKYVYNENTMYKELFNHAPLKRSSLANFIIDVGKRWCITFFSVVDIHGKPLIGYETVEYIMATRRTTLSNSIIANTVMAVHNPPYIFLSNF